MLRHLLSFCFIFSVLPLSAHANFVVSTHPIYLIAKEITEGIEKPELLLENQTGHDVQLTPANRKSIENAELVLWLGKQHEAPLDKVLKAQPKAISILNSGIIQALPQRSPRGMALKDTMDTHVWLDPNNAVRIGYFIAALRSQQHPENRQAYRNNANRFAKEMFQASQKYSASTGPKSYWAVHDAYQYLERSMNLQFAGALIDDPHVAVTMAQIKYLNDSRPYRKMCLLAESHVSASQYQKLGDVSFQSVDENLSKYQDFVTAWKTLTQNIQDCVNSNRK